MYLQYSSTLSARAFIMSGFFQKRWFEGWSLACERGKLECSPEKANMDFADLTDSNSGLLAKN